MATGHSLLVIFAIVIVFVLVSGKQWLTIRDNDVRADHAALSGNVVAPRADFSVGDSQAPYPGHWGLPAEQQIHCRCTTMSVLSV